MILTLILLLVLITPEITGLQYRGIDLKLATRRTLGSFFLCSSSPTILPWNSDVSDSAAESQSSDTGSTVSGGSRIWKETWYPIAVVDELDPAQPNSVTLLGKDLVIWNAGGSLSSESRSSSRSSGGGGDEMSGSLQGWRVAEDMCPHRLAPLSEGYIDADSRQLTCRYHGWAFDGAGKCSCIPQAENREALTNRRSHLQTFPVQVCWRQLKEVHVN